jgi:uncharacterized protein YjbI with pentapeptide repeats
VLAENAQYGFSNLDHANPAPAVLRGANMYRANVSGADFTDVEMATVNMEYTNFSEATNVDIPAYKDHVRRNSDATRSVGMVDNRRL